MKTAKLFTIDLEIVQKLQKESNASGLVNELLIRHYSKHTLSEDEVIEDVKKKINAKEKQAETDRMIKERLAAE